MQIGIRLRDLRIEKELTQKELAKNLGITQDSISLWEKGKRIPDTIYIQKLCDVFGVSTDYLLGRTDDLGAPLPSATPPQFSPEEQELLNLFRRMDETQKLRFTAFGEGMLSAADGGTRKLPR